MSDLCGTHPERPSSGLCARCGLRTCDLCTIEVGGATYCSIVCFTEQALEAKGKKLAVRRSDPLAEVNLKDESVVLDPSQAQQTDESSLAVSAVDGEDATSILDMAAQMKPPAASKDESQVTPVEGRMKEPTSILGMHELAVRKPDGTWLEEPPTSETPLPILLPGTRRSTIQSTCVFHADTPAVVLCAKCGDAICTMCIQDEDQGGRCSPACRRDLGRGRRNRGLLIAAGVTAVALVGWAAFRSKPAAAPAAVETPAQFEARSREAERMRLEATAREEARLRVEAREKEEREKAEAEAKAKEAEEARLAAVAKAEADAKAALAKAEAEAKLKADALAKAEALAAEALRAKEAEARAKEEAAKAAATAKAKAEAEAKAKLEAEEKAKAAALAKAKADAEMAKAKAEAEAKAKLEAEAKAKAEAEAKAAALAAEALRAKEAEAKAKADAAARTAALEGAVRKASALIREATPEFCALADDPDATGPTRLARIDAVAAKLTAARAQYQALDVDAEARPIVDRRLSILDDLLTTLQQYRTRLTAPR